MQQLRTSRSRAVRDDVCLRHNRYLCAFLGSHRNWTVCVLSIYHLGCSNGYQEGLLARIDAIQGCVERLCRCYSICTCTCGGISTSIELEAANWYCWHDENSYACVRICAYANRVAAPVVTATGAKRSSLHWRFVSNGDFDGPPFSS